MASASDRVVLLVEDNRDALTGLFTLLTEAGFAVLTATDGEDALDFLERGIRPQVVILDLMMLKVTGWEVLEYLHRDTELRQIPVIVMTGLEGDATHVAGADVILTKPIQPAELLAAVRRLSAGRHRSHV